MVLEKLRLKRRKLRATDLSSWKTHGGPIEYRQDITHRFLGERSTRLRSIVWKFSGDSDAVISKVDGKTDFEVFTDREEARGFYHQRMRQLRAEMLKEAEEIKAELEQEFAESWRNSKRVFFHAGFKIQAFVAGRPFKINRSSKLLGLLEGPCPECGEEQCFDARQAFTNFLEELDAAVNSKEGWAKSHRGYFCSASQPVRSRCPNCRSYPTLELEAQANKSLLRDMTRRLRK